MKEVIIIKYFLKFKKHFIIGGMIMLFLAFSLFIYINNSNKVNKTITKANELVSKNDKDEEETPKEKEEDEELKTFYVDVKGQVNNPGVYLVNEKNIVNDVIEFAGGLTKDANTKCINLSKKLVEEMVIYVYSSKETKNMTSTKTSSNVICDDVVNNAYQDTKNQTSTSSNQTSSSNETVGIININTADVNTLTKLTGIGESKANDIINYRNQNGPFKSIEDIKNVNGIGDSTYSKIKDQITV